MILKLFVDPLFELSRQLEEFSCNMISQIWSSNEIEAIMRFQDPNRYKRLGKDLSNPKTILFMSGRENIMYSFEIGGH